MTPEERNKILVRAIATYGEESQIDMAIEEMAELTKALCKLKRAKTTAERDAAIGNIIEETADVQITIDQINIIVKNDTEAMQKFKLQRLDKRLFWHEGKILRPELKNKTVLDKIVQPAINAAREYEQQTDSLKKYQEEVDEKFTKTYLKYL